MSGQQCLLLTASLSASTAFLLIFQLGLDLARDETLRGIGIGTHDATDHVKRLLEIGPLSFRHLSLVISKHPIVLLAVEPLNCQVRLWPHKRLLHLNDHLFDLRSTVSGTHQSIPAGPFDLCGNIKCPESIDMPKIVTKVELIEVLGDLKLSLVRRHLC